MEDRNAVGLERVALYPPFLFPFFAPSRLPHTTLDLGSPTPLTFCFNPPNLFFSPVLPLVLQSPPTHHHPPLF